MANDLAALASGSLRDWVVNDAFDEVTETIPRAIAQSARLMLSCKVGPL